METVVLGNVCDVRDGTHDSPKYVTEGIPLITSKNIVDGKIDLEKVNYISKEDYERINVRSCVDDGDILMPMIGTIGNPIVVNKEYDFAIKNVALIKFKKDSKVLKRYVKYLLESNLFKRYVEKENRGGTQKFISLGNIRSFTFPLASPEEQEKMVDMLDDVSYCIAKRKEQLKECDRLGKISVMQHPIGLQEQSADFCHQVDQLKLDIQSSLEELHTLYDCLMQKYFS